MSGKRWFISKKVPYESLERITLSNELYEEIMKKELAMKIIRDLPIEQVEKLFEFEVKNERWVKVFSAIYRER